VSQPDRTPPLASALRMAGAGWHVFPVERGGKRPAIRSAHLGELGATRCAGECGRDGHGLLDATTDPDRIRAWWQAYPEANVGVSCGPSGLVVVDVDTGKGGRPARVLADQAEAEPTPETIQDGAGVLRWLALRHGQLSDLHTATVTTPTGGKHLYFRRPAVEVTSGAGIAGGLGWQVDVRAAGGYVVGAWSRRGSGLYRPSSGVPVAELPGWLLDRLALAGRVPSRAPVAARPEATRAAPAPAAGLDNRATAYLRAAVAGEVQRVLDAGEGGRNVALNRAAFALGQLVATHGLDEDAAAEVLTDAGQAVGLAGGELTTTIRSGLRAGQRSPRGTTP
jgi:hypothetical protein